ncbi:hypothetical protein P691DRAFT_765152 [Macrolepiota fuliginosa MF-IS2]|uniref:Uncharacterized protein n=1 Tax=Macrolepiota fuliginosa MF-IS2 TaxID=1400762 RepID=A0A9P5X452_9AGAR|nr:hypothetical protein P691DRAFT_765152 [Macrolepiota fuliginosa MF-IS2]
MLAGPVVSLFNQVHQVLVPSEFPTYGQLAGNTFLDLPRPQADGERASPTPLPLSDISHNLAQVIQSTAKAAYADGCIVGYNSTASKQFQQTSLVSSRQFTIALGGLDTVVVFVLIILVHIVNTTDMQLFSLQALEEIYHNESALYSK